MIRTRITRSWPSAGAVGKRKSGPRAGSTNTRPSKELPASRLSPGVRPVRQLRRQRTATPILATTPRPAQPVPALAMPCSPRHKRGSKPQPAMAGQPYAISRRHSVPGGATGDCRIDSTRTLSIPISGLPAQNSARSCDAEALARFVQQAGLCIAALGLTIASAATAPRGALVYPRLSREGLEGRFLGLMAYLDGKPEGDNSMPGK